MSDFGAGIFDDEPPRRAPPPPPPAPAPAPASRQPAERPASERPAPRPAAERRETARQPIEAAPPPPPSADDPFTDDITEPASPEPAPTDEATPDEVTEAGPDGPGDDHGERRPRRGRRRRGRRGRGNRDVDAADVDAPTPESVPSQRSSPPPLERPAPLRQPEPRRSEARPVQGPLRRWIVTPATPRQPAVARHGQRIGVVLDLAALQDGARQHGSELSYRRLLRHLTGDRAAAEAVCFLPGDAPRAAAGALTAGGFQVERADSGAALTEQLTAAATAMAQRVDSLILAPGSRDQVRLAQHLREQGVLVETAGFSQDGDPELPHRQLGRDAVFLP